MAGKEITRKITLSVVAGKATTWFDALMASENKRLPLANIIGQTTGYVAGASDFGEFVKFRGRFRGTNLQTSETVDAPVCILPTFVAESLRSALDTGEARSVDFAFGVEVVYDASSVTKYRYEVRDLLPPSESDPLASIEASVVKTLKLAAPVPDTARSSASASNSNGKKK
jgi:hypothetical protein